MKSISYTDIKNDMRVYDSDGTACTVRKCMDPHNVLVTYDGDGMLIEIDDKSIECGGSAMICMADGCDLKEELYVKNPVSTIITRASVHNGGSGEKTNIIWNVSDTEDEVTEWEDLIRNMHSLYERTCDIHFHHFTVDEVMEMNMSELDGMKASDFAVILSKLDVRR